MLFSIGICEARAVYIQDIPVMPENAYENIQVDHIQCEQNIDKDTCATYYVDLSLANVGKTVRRDFFYRTEADMTQIRLVDHQMEYGFMNGIRPCGNPTSYAWDQEGAKLEEKQLTKKIENECSVSLFAHYPTYIEPVALNNPRPEWRDGLCANKNLDVVTTLQSPLSKVPLFISTMGKNIKNIKNIKFFSPQELEVDAPSFIKAEWFALPAGFIKQDITFYRYPDEANTYLALVRAKGFWSSVDEDKYGESKNRIWQAFYYVTPKGAKIITPISFVSLLYFGVNEADEDFGLTGIADINNDGHNDIIIGSPVKLILERYGNGFRSWGFGFYPPGGC